MMSHNNGMTNEMAEEKKKSNVTHIRKTPHPPPQAAEARKSAVERNNGYRQRPAPPAGTPPMGTPRISESNKWAEEHIDT